MSGIEDATPTGLFSSRRNSGDNIALAVDGVDDPTDEQPVRTGFDPMRRLTHNQVCIFKASNALFRGAPWAGLWSGSGGSFSEAGTTRHAVTK